MSNSSNKGGWPVLGTGIMLRYCVSPFGTSPRPERAVTHDSYWQPTGNLKKSFKPIGNFLILPVLLSGGTQSTPRLRGAFATWISFGTRQDHVLLSMTLKRAENCLLKKMSKYSTSELVLE